MKQEQSGPAEAGADGNTSAAAAATGAASDPATTASSKAGSPTAAGAADLPATPPAADSNAWPPAEALNKRVRKLCDLLGQAVAIADAQGLLQPLPDSDITGQAAADAALKGKYAKEHSAIRTGILSYPAAATASGGLEAWQAGGLSTANAAATAAGGWSQPGSPHKGGVPVGLGFNAGEADDLLGDLAEAQDEALQHQPAHLYDDDDDDEEEEDDEDMEGNAAAEASDIGAWQQQRGRGRGGRAQKRSVAAEAAETDAAAVGLGEGGRRRAHKPSKRLAEHVVYDVPDAPDGAWAKGDRQVSARAGGRTGGRKLAGMMHCAWCQQRHQHAFCALSFISVGRGGGSCQRLNTGVQNYLS